MHFKGQKTFPINSSPFSLIYGKFKGFYKFAGCVMLLLQWRKKEKEQCTFTVRVVKSKSDGGDETCKARKRL